MRIIHRFGMNSSPVKQAELATLGVQVADKGFVVFDESETGARWPEIAQWAAEHHLPDLITTRFTPAEREDAAWLRLTTDWQHGYPEPGVDSFGYREATYDLTDYCETCGIGLRQVRPFQMSREPRWGKRNMLQMHWIFGEYFVTPDLWGRAFRPHDIESRPVHHVDGHTLETVVQLVIPASVHISTDALEHEDCPVCGRSKYLPVTRGPFPSPLDTPSHVMVRTSEWFGSGASARHDVLVAQELRQKLLAERARGASFWPAASRD